MCRNLRATLGEHNVLQLASCNMRNKVVDDLSIRFWDKLFILDTSYS